MSVKVKFNLADIEKSAKKLALLSDKNRRLELSDRLAGVLESGTINRFELGQSPEGTPWKPVQRGGKPLIKKGLLMTSITSNATEDYAEVGSNLVYAAIHQTGGTIKARAARFLCFAYPGGFAKVKQVTIAARPYLGISTADEKGIQNVLGRFFEEALS